MKFKIFLLLGIFLFPLISSISCNQTSISIIYNQDQTATSSIQCTNSGNATSVSTSGEVSYFSTTETAFNLGTKIIPLIFSPSTPIGLHSGSLDFGDGTHIPIAFSVQSIQPPQQTGCIIDIFPTILSNIKIQQGDTKPRNIQLNVPSCYSSSVYLQGISLASDEKPIQLGEISLGTIQPGNSVIIPLELNAIGVSTGQYSDTLQILAYNSSGNNINIPSVSVSVFVTSGIQPLTNFSFTQLPTCSLSATELQLNATYSLICTRNNANIEIVPTLDSSYIQGVSVDETSTQYIYNFKPKKVGQTTFLAYFTYKNAPLGDPFTQIIKVQQGLISGSYIDVVFYQKGNPIDLSNLKTGETIIQVIENVSKSLISNYQLYLSGIPVNNTVNLEAKSYELRALSPGYTDKIVNINITNLPLSLSISPVKSSYLVGDIITINSENASYLLDEVLITNPYTFVSSGNKTLKAIKEGYISANLTLLVINKISYKSASPLIEEWKKGKNVLLELTDTASWNVELSELKNDAFLTAVSIKTGEGKLVEFKIDKPGNYVIKSGDQIILTKSIENSGFFDFAKGWKWYVWVLIVSAIFGILWYIVREKEEGQSNVGFDMTPRQ